MSYGTGEFASVLDNADEHQWRDQGDRLRALRSSPHLGRLPSPVLLRLADRLIPVTSTADPIDESDGATRVATDGKAWVLPAQETRAALATDSTMLADTPSQGMRVDARGAAQTAGGGHLILRPASLAIRPGELVAIIGPSGAGKTTLLNALSGLSAPSAGVVLHDGRDIRRRVDVARQVGYVPQDDIIHRELPLQRTLRFAARLRLSSGTDAAEVHSRVAHVMSALGLAGRAGVRISALSGGERKRASIAVELLTRPAALFLDEPTSGLDPATGRELVRLLGRLAADGSTVVFATHNPADIAGCDTVVVLAPGGHLAFAGPPARATAHFQVDTVDEIYQRLADEPDPAIWPVRLPATAPATAEQPSGQPSAEQPAGIGGIAQWLLLTHRSVEVLARSRLTLAILLGSPVMIMLMFLMLFRGGAFDVRHPSPNTTVMILFWIAFGGFFFGLTYGLPQICEEFPVVRRERLAGLRLAPYTLAKLAALLPLLIVVDALLLGVLRVTDRLPAVGLADLGALFVTLLLASASALTLGLLGSAAVRTTAQATLMLPMLCFPQVLFVGAFLPVPVMAAAGRWLSYAMSNRWAFEALGHSAGLERLWRDGGSPLGPPLLASYGDSFAHPAWGDWVVLSGFTAIFLIATLVVLSVKTGRRAGPGGWR
ncbi:MAG TPA: ATP-binding cassette domain-containing protein [Pseudonocardiaceae bacterium]